MNKTLYNPYLPVDEFMPDVEPHVFGDRVYLYGSHDTCDGQDYCLEDYVCWSAPADDPSDWRYEGVIYRRTQDPTNPAGDRYMQAPDVTMGPDGRYYLYYVLSVPQWSDLQICVAVCDTPAGQYEYLGVVHFADGRRLDTPLPFDPAVLLDDDGRVYLYFGFAPHFPMRGQPIPNTMGAYCVELEADMLTCKGEPVNIIPDFNHAAGTEYEAHPFFEAASIRKVGDTYYFVYCSRLVHELCYATSKYPNRDFRFGGTVISNADVGYQGRTAEHARNQIANIHGGMVKLGDQWYISYHRHTHGRQFSRQGCMEPITIDENGAIDQVECTSFGLSGGKAPAKRTLPAWCACNLYKGEGGVFIRFSRERTVEAPYVVVEDEGYVTNITDTGVVGWRYLIFDGEERELSLHVRGCCKGTLSVCLSDTDGEVAGECPVSLEDGQNWTEIALPIRAVSGERPLRLLYSGEGTLELLKVTVR
ncbi:MAG: family 43 glycosylhydrolase [Oscillospiraceae bacterium]